MSAMTDNDFPKWLKEKREAKSWSQSEFARAAGISRQVVSDYEGYKRKYFDEDILRKIARALKLPAETVFRAAGKLDAEVGIDPWTEEMNHKMKLLPPSMRPIAEKLLNSLLEDVKPAPALLEKPCIPRSHTSIFSAWE